MEPICIDHIGIAVNNLEESTGIYEALGLILSGYETVEQQQTRVCFFPCGDSEIELLEPITPDEGPIGKFIANNGGKGGLHHIAIRVPDIKAAIVEMQEKGFRMIDTEPRYGAGGASIAFTHPKATGGALIELSERRPELRKV